MQLINYIQLIPQKIYEITHPGEPWLSQGAIKYCSERLKPDMTGFEWGSGRSTMWFAKRLGRLTSVEYHQGWFEKVTGMLSAKNIQNVDLKYSELEHPLKEPTYRNYDPMPQYVREIDSFENESLDFVVVDGHYRQACVRRCIEKLSTNGLLLIDNYNRMDDEEWGVDERLIRDHVSANARTTTAIFKKKRP